MPIAAPSSPAGVPHLLKAAKQQWRTARPVLNGAAVYLDAGAAEAVAAGVGLTFLLGALCHLLSNQNFHAAHVEFEFYVKEGLTWASFHRCQMK